MHISVMVKQAIEKYGSERRYLLPVLQQIQRQNHYLDAESLREVAACMDLSAAEVHGVASFYHFLPTDLRGRFIISVCKTIVCDMYAKSVLLDTIFDLLKIRPGQTTQDKCFSLQFVNCIGCCDVAPAILINDRPYTNLNAQKLREIIHDYVHNPDGKIA